MTQWSQHVRTLRVREWGIQLVIVGLLAVSYRGALAVDGGAYAACVASVLVCTAFLLAGTYLLNTYCDRADDRFKPAPPHVASVTPALVCMGIGLALAAWLAANRAVLSVAIIAAALGIAYSVPPLHLKKHGWAGTSAAALMQRIPAFWMIALSFSVAWAPALAITAWLVVVGFLFILEHQMEDVEFDRAADVATVVTRYGLPRARRMAGVLYGVFLVITVVAAFVVGRAATSRVQSLTGAGIIVAGSAILMVSARIRYRSVRSRTRVDAPSVEDENGATRRHAQHHR